MMVEITDWVQSQEEEEEQYIDSPDQSDWPSQKAVEVGMSRGEDSGKIQKEEERGERAAEKEDLRIKEAEEEKQMANSRSERYFSMETFLV